MSAPRRARVRGASTTTAALLLTLLVAAALAGCGGKGELVAATPADGAALAAGPEAVDLTFDRPPDLSRSHVGVLDSASVLLDEGELTASGPRTLRQSVRAASVGEVVVGYHVVFDDGTDTSGSVRFNVGTGPAAAASDTQAAASVHQHGVDPLGAALLVVDLVVLVGVLMMLRLRPRRPADDGPPE